MATAVTTKPRTRRIVRARLGGRTSRAGIFDSSSYALTNRSVLPFRPVDDDGICRKCAAQLIEPRWIRDGTRVPATFDRQGNESGDHLLGQDAAPAVTGNGAAMNPGGIAIGEIGHRLE